jgi:hypothetical protein
MAETAENVATSLKVQLEISTKIVEMTCRMATMTDLVKEANRTYKRLNDILHTISFLSSPATQVDEMSAGIRTLMIASQSTHISTSPRSKPAA